MKNKSNSNKRHIAIKKVEKAGHKVYDLGKGHGFKVAHNRESVHYYTDREFFNFANCFGDGKPASPARRIVKKNSKGIRRTLEHNVLHKVLNTKDFDSDGFDKLDKRAGRGGVMGKGDVWFYD